MSPAATTPCRQQLCAAVDSKQYCDNLTVLEGTGRTVRYFDLFTENMTTSVSTQFELPRIQGRQVMHIVDMKVGFDVQGMTVQFDNLFNGNEVLGKCHRVLGKCYRVLGKCHSAR
jgi:hypothetical protein